MTDTEIDRRLALAIGYRPEDFAVRKSGNVEVRRQVRPWLEVWRRFDHTDWQTIGPIAERYDLFPVRIGSWRKVVCGPAPKYQLTDVVAPTPQRAIALAAIAKLERT